MRDYIHFFILFTLLEVLVTALHFLLVRTFNLTAIIGAFLYILVMVTAYAGYKEALYKKKKKEMLDALL